MQHSPPILATPTNLSVAGAPQVVRRQARSTGGGAAAARRARRYGSRVAHQRHARRKRREWGRRCWRRKGAWRYSTAVRRGVRAAWVSHSTTRRARRRACRCAVPRRPRAGLRQANGSGRKCGAVDPSFPYHPPRTNGPTLPPAAVQA